MARKTRYYCDAMKRDGQPCGALARYVGWSSAAFPMSVRTRCRRHFADMHKPCETNSDTGRELLKRLAKPIAQIEPRGPA